MCSICSHAARSARAAHARDSAAARNGAHSTGATLPDVASRRFSCWREVTEAEALSAAAGSAGAEAAALHHELPDDRSVVQARAPEVRSL